MKSRKAEVQRFVDARFRALMKEHHIPAALVSIVEGQEVVIERGFGTAGRHKGPKAAVEPIKARFRVGSLSKLVTATAVMRLVELGKLDLAADVKTYLKPAGIRLVRRYSGTITLVHLLTHTSGFDVTDIGDASRSLKGRLPLRRMIAKRMTPQLYRPGQYHVYTNHGYALLGLIVEQVHGKPFAQSVKELVLEPLGMASSSFAQPLPAGFLPHLVRSYARKAGRYVPLPLDYSNVGPADAFVTTSQDMSRFLLAHLNEGVGQGKRVLKAATVRRMHTRHFGYHEALAGHALGFKQVFFSRHLGVYGKRRGLFHTGGQLGFTSIALVVPELRLGIFICLNRRKGAMRRSFVREFLEKFYPLPKASPRLQKIDGPERYIGDYMRLGYPRSSLESILYLVSPRVLLSIGPGPKGSLSLTGYGCLSQRKAGLLATCKGSDVVAFRPAGKGRAALMAIEQRAYKRVSTWSSPKTHASIFLLCFGLFLLTLLQWPLSGFFGRKAAISEGDALWLKRGARGVSLLFVLYILGLVASLIQASGQGWDYGLPGFTRAILLLPYLGAPLSLALSFLVGRAMLDAEIPLLWRIHGGLLAVCSWACLALAFYWKWL